MPLKWHHIDKCNKNCKKVDVLTSILACLSSFAPFGLIIINLISNLPPSKYGMFLNPFVMDALQIAC